MPDTLHPDAIAAFLRERLRIQIDTQYATQSDDQRITVRLLLGEEPIAEDQATVFVPEGRHD